MQLVLAAALRTSKPEFFLFLKRSGSLIALQRSNSPPITSIPPSKCREIPTCRRSESGKTLLARRPQDGSFQKRPTPLRPPNQIPELESKLERTRKIRSLQRIFSSVALLLSPPRLPRHLNSSSSLEPSSQNSNSQLQAKLSRPNLQLAVARLGRLRAHHL